MSFNRHHLLALFESGSIPPEKLDDALAAAELQPNRMQWQEFMDKLLLWLGVLAIAFSIMFFIAYNWYELGRFAKFALVEVFVILAVVCYWKYHHKGFVAQATLMVASIGLGVLLALFGQTYQTGADPWQLFFNWSLLILPWAVIARFPALWVLVLGLQNLAIVLYCTTFRSIFWFSVGSDIDMMWVLFGYNSLALLAWELLSQRWLWLAERWAVRLIGTGAGVAITWLALYAIFEEKDSDILAVIMWAISMVVLYFVYRRYIRDLYFLAGTALSIIAVVLSFIGKLLFDHGRNEGAFFLMALLVIGMGGGFALWLKKIFQEWHS